MKRSLSFLAETSYIEYTSPIKVQISLASFSFKTAIQYCEYARLIYSTLMIKLLLTTAVFSVIGLESTKPRVILKISKLCICVAVCTYILTHILQEFNLENMLFLSKARNTQHFLFEFMKLRDICVTLSQGAEDLV